LWLWPDSLRAIRISQKLGREGARVFIIGRRQSQLDQAVDAIDGDAAAIQGDISNLADLIGTVRIAASFVASTLAWSTHSHRRTAAPCAAASASLKRSSLDSPLERNGFERSVPL